MRMFTPTEIQAKIISLLRESFIYATEINPKDYLYKEFSTEHFDYWTVTEEIIKKRVITYFVESTNFEFEFNNDLVQECKSNFVELPIKFEELIKDNMSKEYKHKDCYYDSERTQFMLRFSKTYGNLEYYTTSSGFKFPKSKRYSGDVTQKILMHKTKKVFGIRKNNITLILGIRYISLKNIKNFQINGPGIDAHIQFELKNILINGHLGSNFSSDFLNDNTFVDIPNKYSKKCSSFEDILNNIAKKPIPKILISKFKTIDTITLYRVINELEICKIISFFKENISIYTEDTSGIKIDVNSSFQDVDGWCFSNKIALPIADYMALRLKLIEKIVVPNLNKSFFISISNTKDSRIMLRDYINMCYRTEEKINLNITSLKRLKYEHDNITIKFNLRGVSPIKVSKKFPLIEENHAKALEKNNIKFQLIKDSKTLVRESVEMHHCVSGYGPQINAGKSAIYSIKDCITNERATMEVSLAKDDKMYINQLKGICNSRVSNELIQKIHSLLIYTNISISQSPSNWTVEGEMDLPF